MEKQSKVKQVLLGILSGFLMWAVGLLLSGRLAIVEDMVFHNAEFLSFAFPFLASGACIWLALYSAKNKREVYFKTTLIYLFIPYILYGLTILLTLVNLDWMIIIFDYLTMIPLMSIVTAMFACLDKTGLSEMAETVIIIATLLLPMIAGLVASVIVYNKKSK